MVKIEKIDMNKAYEKITALIEYFIAFILVITTRSVYAHLVNVSLHLYIFLLAFMAVYILKITFLDNGFKRGLENTVIFLKRRYRFFVAYYIFTLVFLLFNNICDDNYISTYLIMLPAFVYIYLVDRSAAKRFLERICNVIFVIAAVSLFCYLICSVFKLYDISSAKVVVDWGGTKNYKTFFGIYFERQLFNALGFRNVVRNIGIFTEAPMYSLFLSLALCIEKFITKRNNRTVCAVLLITCLTTLSATGMIVMALVYAYKAVILLKKNVHFTRTVRIVVIVASVLLAAVAAVFFVHRIGTSSGTARIDDYVASFKAWTDSPIFGVGYDNVEYIVQYMSDLRSDNTGVSNSLMVLLAECGIYFFMLYLVPFVYVIVLGIKKKNYDVLFFMFIMAILFVSTSFRYAPILINMIAVAYARMASDKTLIRGK